MSHRIGAALSIALPALTLLACHCGRNRAPKPGEPAAPTREGVLATPLADTLPVIPVKQQGRWWCWAASGQMVMTYFQHPVLQCVEADTAWNRLNCCPAPGASGCDQGGWPPFQQLGFSSTQTLDQPVSWEGLKAEIRARRPVAFSWHWLGDGGHMMVLTGYQDDPEGTLVKVADPDVPKPSTSWMTYMEYVADSFHEGEYPRHTHWNDYYAIAYTGAPAPSAQGGVGPGARPVGSEMPPQQPSYGTPGAAAQAALRLLRRSPAVAQSLVHSQSLVGLTTGAGLDDYMVRLDSLRAYTTAKDPLSLLVKLGRVVFPLQGAGAVYTSIAVRRSATGWQLASFGEYDLTRIPGSSLSHLAAAGQAIVVEIPGLHGISFLGALGPPLALVALTSDVDLRLVAGQTVTDVPALFLVLAAAARSDTTPAPH